MSVVPVPRTSSRRVSRSMSTTTLALSVVGTPSAEATPRCTIVSRASIRRRAGVRSSGVTVRPCSSFSGQGIESGSIAALSTAAPSGSSTPRRPTMPVAFGAVNHRPRASRRPRSSRSSSRGGRTCSVWCRTRRASSSGRSRGACSVRSDSAVVRSSGSATGAVRVSNSTIWAALPTVTCWVATSSRSRAHRASARAVPTVTNALACPAVRLGSRLRSQSVRDSPSGASMPRDTSSETMVTSVTSWVRRWRATRSAAAVSSASAWRVSPSPAAASRRLDDDGLVDGCRGFGASRGRLDPRRVVDHLLVAGGVEPRRVPQVQLLERACLGVRQARPRARHAGLRTSRRRHGPRPPARPIRPCVGRGPRRCNPPGEALPEPALGHAARGALSRLEIGEPAPQELEHRGFACHVTSLDGTTDSAPGPGVSPPSGRRPESPGDGPPREPERAPGEPRASPERAPREPREGRHETP